MVGGLATRDRRRCRPVAGQLQVLHGVVRLLIVQRHGNLPTAVEETRQLEATAWSPSMASTASELVVFDADASFGLASLRLDVSLVSLGSRESQRQAQQLVICRDVCIVDNFG